MDLQTPLTSQQMNQFFADMFQQQLPFNQLLGMEIKLLDEENAEIHFPWQNKLMGNPMQKILHGGVTASVLDTIGGILSLLQTTKGQSAMSFEEFGKQFPNAGTTIDLRIDYLRPGKGEHFVAKGTILRKGKKVAVCRGELINDKGEQIALSTATYLVG